MRTSNRGPQRSSLAAHVNKAIDDWPEHAAGRHLLLSVVQAATNTKRL